MTSLQAPKFTIGQKVKFIHDDDGEAGKVLAFSYDPATGYTYKISARELDFQKKEVINGIKTCLENELVEVVDKEQQATEREAQPNE